MLSFSTRWNTYRHTDGEIMLSEIRELGFDCIEMSHGLKLSLVPGIRRLVQRQRVRISSVQNPCPAPIEAKGDSAEPVEFTSDKRAERQRALRLTCQTIDFAQEFGAEFVILQLGRAPLQGISQRLFERIEKGQLHSRDYVKEKLEGIRQRESLSAELLPRVRESLKEILEYAARKEIKIALESPPDYFEGMPTEREMLQLMDDFQDHPSLGYWHDFGHIQRRENLGLLDHQQWLKTIAPRLFGCHLHDVHWPGDEYRVPLSGMIDFGRLMPLIPKDAPVVWDLTPRQKSTEIKQSLPAWVERFEPN